ncbi:MULTISPECIES: J domain-containing protein [Sphingobium]|uniref:Molecular chaperone DnaJ n=1 Tax=Sphingobium cupriresistens TaxID=1132417 RepID=A0A8G2DZN5_9SPHN|nr:MULTISPECIES: J domain-containing protein [Sphingobium]RYM14485.1 molecular chaperone DnaJ [Sphingobium cupriresistens]WCP13592.1 Co-chaperone protein DjlA [Sphingobium sp. AntQ-1]
MGVLTLFIAALAIWLIWTGKLQRMTAKDGMALGAALVGAVLAAKGKPVIGAPLLIGAALFFAKQGNIKAKARTRPAAPVAPPPADDVAKARALLGVAPDADAGTIRAAHRRLIASVHPDKGGTEALAAQINAARDLLLDDQTQR